MVVTQEFKIRCQGYGDMHNITEAVHRAVQASGLSAGIATVFTPSATSAITTVEFEDGMLADFGTLLEKLAPQTGYYQHNDRWHDGNGFSHVRAALLGPSLTVPFKDGRLILGAWQEITFIDFDNRSRQRRIVVQLLGE
jgi:secondary thiamine-phosphate synthase enzyme